jgi:hypothetical protein
MRDLMRRSLVRLIEIHEAHYKAVDGVRSDSRPRKTLDAHNLLEIRHLGFARPGLPNNPDRTSGAGKN